MTKKTSASNKSRTVDKPLEIWKSADGEWEWRVLKKRSDLIWGCAVKSPGTFGSWEYGDVHAQTVTANVRTFVDLGFGPGYFADLIPVAVGTEIDVPNSSDPQKSLRPDMFPFLCDYFKEESMSFHSPNEKAEIVFFFSLLLENCPAVLEANWGIQYGGEEAGQFQFDLLVYDKPDDPLYIPFFFNTTNEMHRYEMSQLVEQEVLQFFALALQDQSLMFFDTRFVTLPDELRRDLAPVIRDSLLQSSLSKGN